MHARQSNSQKFDTTNAKMPITSGPCAPVYILMCFMMITMKQSVITMKHSPITVKHMKQYLLHRRFDGPRAPRSSQKICRNNSFIS